LLPPGLRFALVKPAAIPLAYPLIVLAMTTAPISVVIPAHNAEAFINQAIQSVQAQTLKVAEIIVIDNDCSDRTPEIARDLGVRVVKEERRGLSIARNAGIRASTEEWVAFLDADDWWATNKIELQWRALREFPDVALISCDNYFAKDGAIVEIDKDVLQSRWNNMSAKFIKGKHCSFLPKAPGDILNRFCPKSPTAVLRRDVFSKVGLFNEDLRYNDDLECFMRVMARYPLAIVELPLVYCRMHDRNRSRNVEGKQTAYLEIVNLMIKHPERYPPGAGEIHRQEVKQFFHSIERTILRSRDIAMK
jgi:glycosyltransferase involved in cell wall biosynthesis